MHRQNAKFFESLFIIHLLNESVVLSYSISMPASISSYSSVFPSSACTCLSIQFKLNYIYPNDIQIGIGDHGTPARNLDHSALPEKACADYELKMMLVCCYHGIFIFDFQQLFWLC